MNTNVQAPSPVHHIVRSADKNNNHHDRFLQMLYQDQDGSGNSWTCQNLDVVSACRGTSVSETYRGNFEVYDGPCRGNFLEGFPIYRSTDRPNRPLYIYPLDYYPDNWSLSQVRGLVRWRIASFQNFDDKTSCRTESANVFQIEFAADGHPYDFYPTIYCFDANGGDLSGYQTSNINIRCNDVAASSGGSSSGRNSDLSPLPNSDDGTKREHAGTITVALGFLMVLFVVGLFIWHRYKDHRGASYSHPRDTETGIVKTSTRTSRREMGADFHQQHQGSIHSRFQDEHDDQEQPSLTPSVDRTHGTFTVKNLRSQLHESSHALREEVLELWNSLHSR
ncbi:hypothetical protein IV203_037248 [Nitzschia inconspicua]|uniref:Uncharacterized protein n=1 Tax=Nitzschia inconspicua TaxID=303405 RepID=A0A9K3PAZ2_9STRA|nr:hypothetical protein IV203_006570 [Nitzschia inconspicua]KAG7364046.1 hypothetical protein IV203_037248 [Nitzschia inconspicua]